MVIEGQHLNETLLVYCLTAAGRSAENDLLFPISVPAEVNDVGTVHQQKPLQIDRPCSRMLVQVETIATWPFLNFLEYFSGFFVDQNSARAPWICA